MRRPLSSLRFGVTVLALVVMAGSLVLFYLFRQTSPASGIVIRGKPIEYWRDDMVRTGNYEAVDALREAGTQAVPFLREPLSRPTTLANKWWVKLWPSLPASVQQHISPPVLAKDARMNTLAALRDSPQIAQLMVADLLPRLRDEDGAIRLHTAITMGNIGPAARDSVPVLREFIKSESSTVRIYSARALWKVSEEVEPALSVLEAGIQDKSAKFRWAAPVFLGEMGSNAVRALPLLTAASKESDLEVASLSIQALAQVSPETVPVLIEHLRSDAPAIRASAAVALGNLGSQAKAAVPALETLLADPALAEPAIMNRPIGKEKVSDTARAALQKIRATEHSNQNP